MSSAIRRLLQEISWEGNASKYHDGGLGKENVLTAEVLQALDYLPRETFLAGVLRAAHGADVAREDAAADAEDLAFDILPGDLALEAPPIRCQPDALLESSKTFVFVEAKRIRTSAFQPEQLARELLITEHHAAQKRALLLLILGSPPPVHVRGQGRLDLGEAVDLGARLISERTGVLTSIDNAEAKVAFVTWAEIAEVISNLAANYGGEDLSATRGIRRIAKSAVDAVAAHG